MRLLSKIVKASAVVLDKEKYKLSPLILNLPDIHEKNESGNPLLEHAEHIHSADEEGDGVHRLHQTFDLEAMLDDAKAQADELLESAQDEYERVVKDAYDNAMEIMENAKKEGFSEGYKEGYDQGYKEGYEATEGLIEEADAIKQDAMTHYNEILQGSEAEMIDLVLEVVQKILQKEMDDDESVIFNLVKAGLRRITQTEVLKIRVSEADYINLVSMKKRIMPLLDKVEDIVIIQDDNMVKGDCAIETDSGNIDSGIQTQLDFVKATFEELLKSE
ncbi:MAG: hypothetical protein JXO44_03990 [Clostridia bacterium]|nr:hypothetical protein [Clostridia bacterium]